MFLSVSSQERHPPIEELSLLVACQGGACQQEKAIAVAVKQGRVGCSPNDAARLNFNGDRNIATSRPNWVIVGIKW
jgi:hypothetical protein